MRSAEARAYVSAHPELAPAADRAAKVAALTAEKVFRHLDDPAAHPLPADAKSHERRLHACLLRMGKVARNRIRKNLRDALPSSAAAWKKHFGDLAAVDLESRTPVEAAVKALPVPPACRLSASRIERLAAGIPGRVEFARPRARAGARTPRLAAPATQLEVVVESVTCVIPSDVRRDEIAGSASFFDQTFASTGLGTFLDAKMKKGDTVAVNRVLGTFSAPSSGFAGMLNITLAERDWVDFDVFVEYRGLLTYIQAVAVGWMWVGLASGAMPVFAVAAIVALAAATAEGILVFAAHDTFQGSDSLTLASAPSPGDVVRRTVALEPLAHIRANYQAQVAWRFV